MTLRNRALLLVGVLAVAGFATTGCELLVKFDSSNVDAGVEADGSTQDAAANDGHAPPGDAGQDSTVANDAGDSSVPDANGEDTGAVDAADAATDAGCSASSDCPIGQACDLLTRACTVSCSSGQPCNGICCTAAGSCAITESQPVCGASGAMCGTCVGNTTQGSACVALTDGGPGGTCGCEQSTDCPANQACDTTTHTCTTSCGTSAQTVCNGGCCTGGSCTTGLSATAGCGASGGACVTCGGTSVGAACVATTGGGMCGCTGAGDCDGGACNIGTNACVTTCSATEACNGSCCNAGANDESTCAAGASPTACGPSGAACMDCTNNASGHACVSGACGCNSQADCPVGNSCSGGTCVTTCTASQQCNGACCSIPGGSTSGTCVTADTSQGTCGVAAGVCSDCSGNASGTACLSGADAGASLTCGCTSAGDCPSGSACNTTTHQCGDSCGAAGLTACSGTCCDSSGKCAAADNGQTTCGAAGGTCTDCAVITGNGTACVAAQGGGSGNACGCNATTDCPADMACNTTTHQCTTACDSDGGPQQCNGGCCNAGVCTTGVTASTACGANGGACVSCAGNSMGNSCVATTGGGMCGCGSSGDCNGTACDTTAKQCTAACDSDGGTQQCNGACCDPLTGMCTGGSASTTCGGTGQVCLDCTNNASGHACVSGACGCTTQADCPAGNSCSGGKCVTTCSSSQPCNGACCSDAVSGSCVLIANEVNTQCGTAGSVCKSCTDTTTCTAGEACQCDVGATGSCLVTSITMFSVQGGGAINVGSQATLQWTTSTDATICSIDDGTGPVSVNCTGEGSTTLLVTPPTTSSSTLYTLSAKGTGGTATATTTVTYNPPSIQTFTSSGTSTSCVPTTDTLAWTSTSGVSATLVDPSIGSPTLNVSVNDTSGDISGSSFPPTGAGCGDSITLTVTGVPGTTPATQTITFY